LVNAEARATHAKSARTNPTAKREEEEKTSLNGKTRTPYTHTTRKIKGNKERSS
jgi:hypothetical protein